MSLRIRICSASMPDWFESCPNSGAIGSQPAPLTGLQHERCRLRGYRTCPNFGCGGFCCRMYACAAAWFDWAGGDGTRWLGRADCGGCGTSGCTGRHPPPEMSPPSSQGARCECHGRRPADSDEVR